MTRFGVATRGLAAGVLLAGSLARPAFGFDLLEGLRPADFHTGGLARLELHAAAGAAPLDPADWLPAARAEASARGGTTLGDVGVPAVAAEVVRVPDRLGTVAQPRPADLRVLASPDLRGSLSDLLKEGGNGDLGSLGEILGEVGQGDLGGALDEVLDGGLLEELPLDALPVDELLDVLDALGGTVTGLLPGLLGPRNAP